VDYYGERKARAYNESLGAEPAAGSRAEPLVRESAGKAHLNLKGFVIGTPS